MASSYCTNYGMLFKAVQNYISKTPKMQEFCRPSGPSWPKDIPTHRENSFYGRTRCNNTEHLQEKLFHNSDQFILQPKFDHDPMKHLENCSCSVPALHSKDSETVTLKSIIFINEMECDPKITPHPAI